MKLNITKKAEKQIKKLPDHIKQKTKKSFRYLLEDYRHSSLKSKKRRGEDKFEARIDRYYRFTYVVEGENIYILTVGPHP